MNNKGFTLVELLAVMIILSAISLVAVGGITSSLEKRNEKTCIEQRELAIDAAKIYFSLHNETEVTVGTLKANNYFNDNNEIGELNNDSKITIDLGSAKYLYDDKDVKVSCKED